jgi:hypothetical protein
MVNTGIFNTDEFGREITNKTMTNNDTPAYAMDYEKYRDDQMNTGVIAALIGGFALTNSWEMNIDRTLVASASYVLAIIAVHACTCSALTSAFIYRTLTISDEDKAVVWMQQHPWLASLPIGKFVFGTLCYLVSVILVSWKELSGEGSARLVTLMVGILSVGIVLVTGSFLTMCPPAKLTIRGEQ